MPETATMDVPFVGTAPPTTHRKGRLDEAAWVRGVRAWGPPVRRPTRCCASWSCLEDSADAHLAMGAAMPAVTRSRSRGASSRSIPRRPPETSTVSCARALSSSTVGSARF